MATYVLNVDLIGVDSITGVIGTFSGKVRGKGNKTVFSQAETVLGSSIEFRVRAKGDLLTGSFDFAADENASYTFEGQAFGFTNPGPKRVKIKAKGDDRFPSEEISFNFNKTGQTTLTPNSFALRFDDIPFGIVAAEAPLPLM